MDITPHSYFHERWNSIQSKMTEIRSNANIINRYSKTRELNWGDVTDEYRDIESHLTEVAYLLHGLALQAKRNMKKRPNK